MRPIARFQLSNADPLFLIAQNFLHSHSRRQQILVRSAAKSARVVANLYPEFARNQLFGGDKSTASNDILDMASPASDGRSPSPDPIKNDYDEEAPPDRGGVDPAAVHRPFDSGDYCEVRRGSAKGLKIKVSDFVDTPATKLKRFLAQPQPTKEYDSHLNADIGMSEPIAEVFEKTTVMLADIVGFTAWW